MDTLATRVALVTGAGRGIGAAIAQTLAQMGAAVGVADVDEPAAQEIARQIAHAGGRALALAMDVTDRASVHRGVESLHARWERIDILVNNAGICPLRPFEEIEEAEWDRVLATNLKGAFLCAQAVMPGMRERRFGRVINIASSSGKIGGLMVGAHYAASKGGLIALTFTLARLYAPYGITVNAIAPGPVESPLTRQWPPQMLDELRGSVPLGRLGRPADVAHAVAFLASDAAAFITGEVLDVNGGLLMD